MSDIEVCETLKSEMASGAQKCDTGDHDDRSQYVKNDGHVEHRSVIAPQFRVEVLREDGHSSPGVSDLDDTLSDMEGKSPAVSDQEGMDKSPSQEKPFMEPSAELQEKIINQVEFYFSDANILKDAFLLKHVKRNKHGYVSLKLVTSFRKMKALTKDYRVVAYSLNNSNQLEVNEEGTKVRRCEPLPDYDETTPSRTVVAINLPFTNPNIENVAELFSKCGEISLIRVLKPGKPLPPDVKKHLSQHPEFGNLVCAVVEFENHESAKKSCETMTNSDDWRKGLSVTLLAKKPDKRKSDPKGKKGALNPSNEGRSSSSYDSRDRSLSPRGDQDKGDDEQKKKPIRVNKKVIPVELTQGEGDSVLSSDEEQLKRNFIGPSSRSSLSPKPEMTRLSPSNTPRSTPKNTPKTSPRNSPNVNRRRASHGKSPLASDTLSPGTSPRPSPCGSPESRRRGSNSLEASPSPGCSPWLQRKLKAQQEGSISPLVGSPMGSPRVGRRLLNLEGVLRQPKGPDGTAGFYGGIGRGKPVNV